MRLAGRDINLAVTTLHRRYGPAFAFGVGPLHFVWLVGPEAARFVTLIDALYEHRVKLLAAADAEPDGLYTHGAGAFEFARTASRLMEMRSADYLAAGHGTREQ